MSKVCSICGKGKLSGNTVSHSNRKAPTLFEANLQKTEVTLKDGTTVKGYVCARCLKTIRKNGAKA